MLREEAEREAERRNHEDPDRGRYELQPEGMRAKAKELVLGAGDAQRDVEPRPMPTRSGVACAGAAFRCLAAAGTR